MYLTFTTLKYNDKVAYSDIKLSDTLSKKFLDLLISEKYTYRLRGYLRIGSIKKGGICHRSYVDIDRYNDFLTESKDKVIVSDGMNHINKVLKIYYRKDKIKKLMEKICI